MWCILWTPYLQVLQENRASSLIGKRPIGEAANLIFIEFYNYVNSASRTIPLIPLRKIVSQSIYVTKNKAFWVTQKNGGEENLRGPKRLQLISHIERDHVNFRPSVHANGYYCQDQRKNVPAGQSNCVPVEAKKRGRFRGTLFHQRLLITLEDYKNSGFYKQSGSGLGPNTGPTTTPIDQH
jgi:hypothetical protein